MAAAYGIKAFFLDTDTGAGATSACGIRETRQCSIMAMPCLVNGQVNGA